MQQPRPHNLLESNHSLLRWNVRAQLQITTFLNYPENHRYHLSRHFHLPHQHSSNRLSKHTCFHSLSLPYIQEQLRNYWASFHKYLERWLFTSSSKDTAHILLYTFLILLFYSHCIYITMIFAHKEIFCFKILKVILAFNSHFLIVFVLATCNTSLDQPSLPWYIAT